MIEVQVKGTNDVVQFPDEMSDEQIKQVLQRQYQVPPAGRNIERALTPLPNEAKPYEPSMAESTGQAIADYLFDKGIVSDRYGAQQVGENLSSILGVFPGVGDAQAGDEFGSAIAKGDTGGAILAGVGAIPVIGDATKSGVKALSKAWKDKGIDSFVRENDNSVVLEKIVVPEEMRGAGVGTQAMQELMDYADAAGKRVELTPSSDFGGSKGRLIEFYKRMGFVDNKGKSKNYEVSESMYRDPLIRVADDVDYRGSHYAPDPEENAPAYDVTGGGLIYPDDFYSPKGLSYYNPHTESAPKAYSILQKIRGNPDAELTIYRAVPKSVEGERINPGDWVAITEDYARQHGEGPLGGDYRIIKQKVKAKDIWTSGDSFEEWGYHPSN